MEAIWDLSAHLPEVELGPGDLLCAEGQPGGSIWVLVNGQLDVSKNGQAVSVIERPGSVIGEMSVLLNAVASATVTARTDCVLRHAEDGPGFLRSDATLATHVAMELARRLELATGYLADLKQQYQGAPGLQMVDEVMRRLASRTGAPAQPGSARDPDPTY